MRSVPACTFTVPVLLNVRLVLPIACVPACVLFSTPALLNTCPLLLNTVIGTPTVEFTLKVPLLVTVVGVLKYSRKPSAPRFTVPVFTHGLPTPSLTFGAPVTIVVSPAVVSVPVPVMFPPPLQLNAPLSVTLPLPNPALAGAGNVMVCVPCVT